jgi:hypothetical protein
MLQQYSETTEVCNISPIVPAAEYFHTAQDAEALMTVLPMMMHLQVMGHT